MQVVTLPNEALQDARMIRKPVENIGRGQTKPFKLAAKMGSRYTQALTANQAVIERNVKENLWERHMRPIFG